MGAGHATLSHDKEQAIIKDQLSLSNSAMKSPASLRKNLRVSFTTSDLDRPPSRCDLTRRRIVDSQSGHQKYGTSSRYDQNSHVRNGNYSEDKNGDVSDSGISNCSNHYVPTHLPPSINGSNNNHLPNTAYRYSQYDNNDDFVPPKPSTSNSSRRSRTRSVSPKRSERIIIPSSLHRSDVENLKSAIRAARSASTSGRKTSSVSSDSSQRQKDRMTTFMIGRPAKFSPGAFGDMGIFKSISSVNDQLYICGVMALSEEKIKALKIDCVINATLEWPPFQIRGLETVRVQVDDVPSANLAPYFDKVANKMNEVISRGGRVLVHCMAGISGSSTLCIAYLMKYKGLSLQQAYGLMKTRRPLIRPNEGFWRQLIQYEKELKRHKVQMSNGTRGTAVTHGTTRTARQHKTSDDNPSMTVTGFSGVQNGVSKPSQKVSTSHGYRASATGVRLDDRKGFTSMGGLPAATSMAPLTRSTSNHKLGTLRSSGTAGTRLNTTRQRDIALVALRSGDHWSTTYANDYSKQYGARR